MKCTSCPDAIAKTIEKVYQQQIELGHWAEPAEEAAETVSCPVPSQTITTSGKTNFCQECGARIEHEGGCVICRNCGFSKCG